MPPEGERLASAQRDLELLTASDRPDELAELVAWTSAKFANFDLEEGMTDGRVGHRW